MKSAADLQHAGAQLRSERRHFREEERRDEGADEIGDEDDDPQPRELAQFQRRAACQQRQDRGDRVLGEKLLARKHHHEEADAIAEALDERAPWRIRQMRVQDRLGQKRKADRETRGDARPPERNGRSRHLFLAKAAHDLVDDRGTRTRTLLDVFDLVLADFDDGLEVRRLRFIFCLPGGGRSLSSHSDSGVCGRGEGHARNVTISPRLGFRHRRFFCKAAVSEG